MKCKSEGKMQKFVILALAACLLAQFSVAFPSAKVDSKSSESSEEAVTARDKLYVEIIKDFTGLTDFVLEKGVSILEKVIKDPTITAVDTEDMKKHKSRLNKFIKLAKEIIEKEEKEEKNDSIVDNILGLFASTLVLVEMADICDSYNTTEIKDPSTDVVLIESALKKYDVDEIEEEVEKKQKDTVDEMTEDVDEYLKSLTPEEKEKESKMVEWFKKLSEEKCADKKLTLFNEFLKLYSDEQTATE